jgi:hypothetical protein
MELLLSSSERELLLEILEEHHSLLHDLPRKQCDKECFNSASHV